MDCSILDTLQGEVDWIMGGYVAANRRQGINLTRSQFPFNTLPSSIQSDNRVVTPPDPFADPAPPSERDSFSHTTFDSGENTKRNEQDSFSHTTFFSNEGAKPPLFGGVTPEWIKRMQRKGNMESRELDIWLKVFTAIYPVFVNDTWDIGKENANVGDPAYYAADYATAAIREMKRRAIL